MATFSERHGYTEMRSLIQRADLDSETRTQIWNVLTAVREQYATYLSTNTSQKNATQQLWVWYFKGARDEFPGEARVWGKCKQHILTEPWTDVFDLLEAFVSYMKSTEVDQAVGLAGQAVSAWNKMFEMYLVAYRFIGDEITPVDSNAEAEAVSAALNDSGPFAGARHSLDRAVELLADRETPDYPNSIKESISAVEAVVKKVTGEGTLGAGLSKLESAGLTIHPALKVAWSKMYGWASDANGIRHAGIDPADADQALAKYMLVTCSAFVSYLIEEGRKVNLH